MFITDSPSISSDGQKLTYASAWSGHGDIYVMAKGENPPARVTSRPQFESSPLFTPNGKQRIAFIWENDGRRHIRVMKPDGTNQSQLTQGNVLDNLDSFSSDGRYLLFYRFELPSSGLGRSVKSSILRMDLLGKNLLSAGNNPLFCPDGRSVVFTPNYDDLYRLSLDKQDAEPPRIPGRGCPIAFSADGKYLLIGRWLGGRASGLEDEIWVQDLENNNQ